MRALLLVVPVSLVAALVTGCFNLKNDDSAFCPTLTCGVYVSSSLGSDANGNGTRDNPYSTIARAVQAAHGAPVYACGEAFTGAISLTSSALLYGARDCKAGWEHKAETPTTLTAPPGVIPLRIAADIDVSVRMAATEVLIFQRWEIGIMDTYLAGWNEPRGDLDRSAMNWMEMNSPVGSMPGMQTEASMEALRAAEGRSTDLLFLSMMREHHRGGVHMGEYAAKHASDSGVRDLAGRMARYQQVEANEYSALLQRLGLE